MRNIRSSFILLVFILSFSCTQKEDVERKESNFTRDLNEIQEEGVLRALTTYSGTSYFLYRGKTMGFEYELLKRFADSLGVDLEVIVAKDIDSLFDDLMEGKADIIAHSMTITSERKEEVDFTDYLYLTKQVLVQKKPDNWREMKWSELNRALIHDPIELIGDTVSVRKNSSYHERIINLSNEMGGEIFIDTISGELSTDEIIKKVVEGEIKYTIADDNIAAINASFYPVLDIEVPISFSQRVGWAVRPGSEALKKAANKWLDKMKDHVDYYVIFNKYFKNERDFRKRVRSDFFSLNNNKISQYDEIIKKHAEKIGWDWRLLASIIYQESQFNPKASSWTDAKGLMQLMPLTAKEMGVENRLNPDDNIRGGTQYLKKLWNRFEEIEDESQRMKFTLAAYNCGLQHVFDAQKLADLKSLDRHVWDGNVSEMILALSYPKNYNNPAVDFGYVRGIEPYTYVKQIFERFYHYKQFIDI